MYITAQGCRLWNDLCCVEWDVKLYYTIPYPTHLYHPAHVLHLHFMLYFLGQVSLPYIRRLTQVAYILPFSFNENHFPVRIGKYSILSYRNLCQDNKEVKSIHQRTTVFCYSVLFIIIQLLVQQLLNVMSFNLALFL